MGICHVNSNDWFIWIWKDLAVFFRVRTQRPRAQVKLIIKKLIGVGWNDDRSRTASYIFLVHLRHKTYVRRRMCLSQYLHNQIDLTNWIQIINSVPPALMILTTQKRSITFSQYLMICSKMIDAHTHTLGGRMVPFSPFSICFVYINHLTPFIQSNLCICFDFYSI